MNVKQKLQLVAAGSLLLVGMQAHAGYTLSDMLTVYDPDGNIYKQAVAWEAAPPGINNEEQDELGWFYIIPDAGLTDPSQFLSYTQVVDTDGTIGDVFGVIANADGCLDQQTDGNSYCLGFSSAPEGSDSDLSSIVGDLDPTLPIVHEDVIVDPAVAKCTALGFDSNCWDATKYLNPDLQGEHYTAFFISQDIHVPEPTSLALLGLGGLAMSFVSRASRKRS